MWSTTAPPHPAPPCSACCIARCAGRLEAGGALEWARACDICWRMFLERAAGFRQGARGGGHGRGVCSGQAGPSHVSAGARRRVWAIDVQTYHGKTRTPLPCLPLFVRAQVKTGTTGHAESVQLVFDPKQVTYDQLLDTFLASASCAWSVRAACARACVRARWGKEKGSKQGSCAGEAAMRGPVRGPKRVCDPASSH